MTTSQSRDGGFFAAVRRRLQFVNEWVAARQTRATLERPLGYSEVLRWLFWHGLPGFAGPLVILVGQIVLYGEQVLVLFGGGGLLFVLAGLTAAAHVREVPSHTAGFLLTAGLVGAGMAWWATTESDTELAVWVVAFFAFTSLLVGGAVHVGIENRIDA